jgi:hypothetical protein
MSLFKVAELYAKCNLILDKALVISNVLSKAILFLKKYKAMALYIAPVSIKTYSNFEANAFAKVLFPQEEKPSMAMIILFDMAFIK